MNENEKKKIPALYKIVLAVLGIIAVVILAYETLADKTEQIKATVTLEAGEEFNFDPNEYFTFKEKLDMEDWTIDTTSLNTSKLGKYDVIITYKHKDYTIEAEVVDTKAPYMDMTERYVFTNDLENMDTTSMMTFYDGTEGKVEVSRYTKIENLRLLNDKEIDKLVADIVEGQDPKDLMQKENSEADGEGIYRAVLSVTDEAGNMDAEEILVIYDTTAPEGEFEDVTVTQEDVTAEPEITLGSRIKDNVDGTMKKEDMELTMAKKTDAENEYLVTAKVSDRAGNVLEGEYTIKVKEGNPEEESKTESGTASSNNSSTSNTDSGSTGTASSGSGSNSGTGTSNNTGMVETINGFTIDYSTIIEKDRDIARRTCAAGYYNIIDYDGGCSVLIPSPAEIDYGTELLRAHIESLGYEMGFTIAAGFYNTGAYYVACSDYKTPWIPPEDDYLMPGGSGEKPEDAPPDDWFTNIEYN